ncbi:gp79 [Mycobacterium phage Che9c]|uniref:Uncharacterized protein n=1 Tax=Mycobacterium phage Che9c TaxID=2907832 RepID=Q854S1_9CAUD|nr:gp79 [Mycobacterium phage Che9c]AAN12637.1 hypothetical protein PBI_CHE9C_79 [Mycobacterium phage Che9c]
MRRTIAGALIRLAHKVYPPKVTIEQGNAAADAGRTAGRVFAAELRRDQARRDLAAAEAALTEARLRDAGHVCGPTWCGCGKCTPTGPISWTARLANGITGEYPR